MFGIPRYPHYPPEFRLLTLLYRFTSVIYVSNRSFFFVENFPDKGSSAYHFLCSVTKFYCDKFSDPICLQLVGKVIRKSSRDGVSEMSNGGKAFRQK